MSNKNIEKNDEKKVLPGSPINWLITIYATPFGNPCK